MIITDYDDYMNNDEESPIEIIQRVANDVFEAQVFKKAEDLAAMGDRLNQLLNNFMTRKYICNPCTS